MPLAPAGTTRFASAFQELHRNEVVMPSNLVPVARLWWEAAGVMALRGAKWNAEATRAMAEKPPAFAKAAMGAALAYNRAALLRPFDPVGASNAASLAWLRALKRETSANRRRLARPRRRRVRKSR
jgi:hypothetical protein